MRCSATDRGASGRFMGDFVWLRAFRMISRGRMGSKTVLITGASRGIGRGIALELARAGCRVAINYAGNVEAAREALALVRAAGGDGFVVQGDIAVAADRERI